MPLFQSANVILMVQLHAMRMVIAFAKRDSQAANVMNANQISLVTNVIHANQITTSSFHHVKVCNNKIAIVSWEFNFVFSFQSVVVILMVQPVCNVMPMGIALAKMDLVVNNVIFAKRRDSQAANVMNVNQMLLVTNVMNVNQITSTTHHVKVCKNTWFLKSHLILRFRM